MIMAKEGKWRFSKYVTSFPTINEIKEGIKKQEKVQLLLTSGLHPESGDFEEAYEGKCAAWDSYFADITDYDHNEPLNDELLYSPTSQTTETCLYLYSQDGWLFKELNSGSKEGDQAKVHTLGPFARAFGAIIEDANM